MTSEIKIITLRHPCSQCLILTDCAIQIAERLAKKYKDVSLVVCTLDSPSKARQIKELEVEKFPAIIYNGIQITAGSIPDRRVIENMILADSTAQI